jgi:hypothetical protein
MKLCQSESLGALDQHDRSIRDVNTDLDHRSRNQDVGLFRTELLHDAVLLLAGHTPVQDLHLELREDFTLQELRFGNGSLGIKRFGFFH